MIEKIAHPELSEKTTADEDLFAVSCGYYRISQKSVQCIRADGRGDFFLFYVLRGKSRYVMNDREYIATAGDVVFYNYMDKQNYTHLADCDTQIYWLHFNGRRARPLLEDLGITESMVLRAQRDLAEYFENIINELAHQKQQYYKVVTGNIYLILANIARMTERSDPLLDYVISLMHDMENNAMSLDAYAKACGLSRSQMIRRFRQYTGQTPIQFKNRIIVKSARYYLENTDYSVSQIAAVLRFENVYYFSALFKKQTGLSPTQYKSRAAMKGIPPPPIQK